MKKLLLLVLLLMSLVACNMGETVDGITESNENIMFFVSAGQGAEKVPYAIVEVKNKRGRTIFKTLSNADGQVILHIPKSYIKGKESVDVVINKEKYGETKIQDLYLGRLVELRDITLFKQPLSYLGEEELDEKDLDLAKSKSPIIKEIKVLTDNNSKSYKIFNEELVPFDMIDSFELEIEGKYPIASSGHKWKGIRGDINNFVSAYSNELNTEETSFVRDENGNYIYSGSILMNYKLFPGENFYEIVVQDVESNQTIKRVYFETQIKNEKTDQKAVVVIRDHSFSLTTHNQGYYYLPYRNIDGFATEEKADVGSLRRLRLNFSVEDMAKTSVAIRGYNVYYKKADGQGMEDTWKLYERITYPDLKLPNAFAYAKTLKNAPYEYENFAYTSYGTLFDQGVFYEFKVEVFDGNRNILGVSNTIKTRPLGFFSIKAHGEYDTHGSNGKILDSNNIEVAFEFSGLKELNDEYTLLNESFKSLVKERRVDFGLEMRSIAGGYASSIVSPAIGTGIPFVARINDDGSVGVEAVISYAQDAWYYKDYGISIPGGRYENLLPAIEGHSIGSVSEVEGTYVGKINYTTYQFLTENLSVGPNTNLASLLKDESNGIGLELDKNFIKPGIAYEWDIAGHPLMNGSSSGYSPAKYVEEYKEEKVNLPFTYKTLEADANGNVVEVEKDYYLVRGESHIRINSRTSTPDGAYTIITK